MTHIFLLENNEKWIWDILNKTSFIVIHLSFSGPAVHYNPDFNKRIPVTGFGGQDLLFIILNFQELLSKIWTNKYGIWGW